MVTLGQTLHQAEIQGLIEKAIRKIGGSDENDLCKFLPSSGGYMHHFTLRKLKQQQPSSLADMIGKYVLSVDKPKKLPPKARAARGSRKKKDVLVLSRGDLERMLDLAKRTGDTELLGKLMPRRPIASLKRELINSIRAGKVDVELWASYAAAATYQSGSGSHAQVVHIAK